MASASPFNREEHIRATVYGNAMGDAIGLLTEFMNKDEAKTYYGKLPELEFEQKVPDMHRSRWKNGDWTDDTDQLILILQSILENKGEVGAVDFGRRLKDWARHGFPELGDHGGMGIGATTTHVLRDEQYDTDPHASATKIWELTDRFVAPNGGVMRTSILGLHQYWDLDQVVRNTIEVCKVTHADPRCQASCVAVTTAIAMMIQRDPKHVNKDETYNAKAIRQDAYDLACKHCLPNKKTHAELKKHMFAKNASDLKLSEHGKIGYTYKCLGAGFWAFMQKDFRKALQKIVMSAGDADTNGAVAGALLGCKLGLQALPPSWMEGLVHREWLDVMLDKFVAMQIAGVTETDQSNVPEMKDEAAGST